MPISLTQKICVKFRELTKRLYLWLNEYMPLILSGFGAILIAIAFNLWIAQTNYSKWAWFVFILALFVYLAAILLQWKKEKEEEKERKRRIQREEELHKALMVEKGWTKDFLEK
jgi:Ca2+/Na+ antiporter